MNKNELRRENISAHFPNEPQWQIHCLDTVGSTNDYAKALAAKGAPHGTVILADRQTGGRGRMGRSFHSPGGQGIYLSVLLRPGCPPDELMHLTCATAVAMCDAVESAAHIRPGIKWTNDLVIGSRKLGGILTELSVDYSNCLTAYAVIGVGINCTQRAEDFPPELGGIATSLALETGKAIDRCAVAAAMIAALQKMDAGLFSQKQAMLDRYRAGCITLGKEISILRADTVEHAIAVDIDSDGALLVRTDRGEKKTVSSGEVSIRGMYGYV
ncbi:MAG: biotin--[Oscillospiraceae bacterium]|nr:biotin--[acetyl-CoA-carboxylase] ligase [Oscillospiraceae bacterium]